MDRKEFIMSCGAACLGAMGISLLGTGCTPSKYIQVSAEGNVLKVQKKEFIVAENNKIRRYLILKADAINHPVVLYRFSENEYEALLMQCTHQNAELTVSGDLLSCPAHGSQFTNRGEVIQGPAEQKLLSYKVTSDADNVYINLA